MNPHKHISQTPSLNIFISVVLCTMFFSVQWPYPFTRCHNCRQISRTYSFISTCIILLGPGRPFRITTENLSDYTLTNRVCAIGLLAISLPWLLSCYRDHGRSKLIKFISGAYVHTIPSIPLQGKQLTKWCRPILCHVTIFQTAIPKNNAYLQHN
jgi:hypothetical protein